MNVLKMTFLILFAGGLGGFITGILVWGLGASGVTPALGFNMTPELTVGWISRRVFASALWGIIFLIPIYQRSPVIKGTILGVLPWLSSVLYVLPFKMDVGYWGVEMGMGTPVWTLFFGCLWGVIGTLFLARVRAA